MASVLYWLGFIVVVILLGGMLDEAIMWLRTWREARRPYRRRYRTIPRNSRPFW